LTLESLPGSRLADVKRDEVPPAFLQSGKLARIAGVSPDTLRHYERVGVLARPTRASNGYRRYPPESIERLRLVRRAMDVGFTLQDLGRILRARERGAFPCQEVRRLAAAKLEELTTRLGELEKLRDELAKTLSEWDERLEGISPGEPAYLLETLSNGSGIAEIPRRRRVRGVPPRARKEKK
jgi:DNA-binding transcriptional MerR regulator